MSHGQHQTITPGHRGLPRWPASCRDFRLRRHHHRGIFSHRGCKGFEIGSGFSGTRLTGIEHNDPFVPGDDGRWQFEDVCAALPQVYPATREQFLPQALSEEEVDDIVNSAIEQTGASSIKDMGKVMGQLKNKLQGRADMGAVSARIKARLSG